MRGEINVGWNDDRGPYEIWAENKKPVSALEIMKEY